MQAQKKLIRDKYFDETYEKLGESEQIKINEKVEAEFAKLNQELDNRKKGTRLWNLSYNCIYGTDANPRMARTSKMNMIMHGDGHGGVHHSDGLLNINGIFENRFNIILTNPPFGARVDKKHKITLEDKYKDTAKIKHYIEKYGSQYQTGHFPKFSVSDKTKSLWHFPKFSVSDKTKSLSHYVKIKQSQFN